MTTRLTWAAAALAALAAAPALAQTPIFSEARVGVYAFDVDLLGDGSGGKEDAAAIAGEILLDSPDFLSWAGSPRPHGVFSVHTDGGTNFGGVGLSWTTNQERRVFGTLDFGYVVHDGVVELPPEPSDPDRIRLDATRVIFGSRDVFRTALGVGVRVTDRVDAHAVFEHLSHGQILGSGKNEGLDNLGVRFAYRYD